MRRYTSRYRLIIGMTLMMAVSLLTIAPGQLQVNPLANRQANQVLLRNLHNSTTTNAIFIEPTAPILNLFSRAEEGIMRRDWKFAIDSLQRIIEDPEASLMPRVQKVEGEAILYESARKKAMYRIASLPREGLRAYRLLYDGKAKGYLDRAKKEHNPELLRLAVNRYLLTRYGDDAADLLASWSLDRGRITEAVSVLNDLLEFVPDSDIPKSLIISKLAVAYFLMGRSDSADKIIDGYNAGHGIEDMGESETTSSLPEWFSQLSKVNVSNDAAGSNETDQQAWPVFGGSPQRIGRMTDVTPMLAEETPWWFRLSGSQSYSWRRRTHYDQSEPDILPEIHMVADRDRLYIRKPFGCVALDLDELHVLWENPPPEDVSGITFGNTNSASASFVRWSDNTAFSEDVFSSIALANDFVFTIEPDGQGSVPQRDVTVDQPVNPRPVPIRRRQPRNDTANRLVAYDAITGERQWHRGRTYDPNDLVGDVAFRSIPLSAQGLLWVVYIDRADLYVGVIQPEDGSIKKRILLGSYQSAPSGRGPALHPAFAEDTLFVPTNLGLLYAVDTKTYEVRWASQYRFHSIKADVQQLTRRRGRNLQPKQANTFLKNKWRSTPPMVTNGTVLLAARDTEELQAFSAVDGALLWNTSAEDQYYMIGTDHRYVWLGGRSIAAYSITDGVEIWRYELDEIPSGHAVLAGKAIHVPTSSGLITLNADDGSVLRKMELPGSQPPLGNLLCMRSMMFSLDPAGVRMYPDVAQIFPEVSAEYQTHPEDVSNMTRLAWLHLLRQEYQQAYEVLHPITDDMVRDDPWRKKSIAHVRVKALKEMAIQLVDQPEAALELLERARTFAVDLNDQLDVSLAMARLQNARGDYLQAYEILYQLGFTQHHTMMVERDDHVQIGLRLDLARRMRDIEQSLNVDQRHQLSKIMTQRFKQALVELEIPARSKKARRILTALADLDVVGGVGSLSLLSLADWEAKHLRFERAEQLLMDCVRFANQQEVAIASMMKLYELYVDESLSMFSQAIDRLDELDRRYAQAPLPVDLFDTMGWSDTLLIKQGLVEDWTGLMREQHHAKKSGWTRSTPDSSLISLGRVPSVSWRMTLSKGANNPAVYPFTLTGDLQRSLSYSIIPRIIHLDHDLQSVMGSRIIYRSYGDVIYCQDSIKGSLLWQTTLQLPQTFELKFGRRVRNPLNITRHAVTDGQIGVFSGREGLYAIGLFTGRRLWVKKYDIPSEFGKEGLRDSLMAADKGYVAAMPHVGRLSMLRLRDGFMLWQRDLRGETVGKITMASDVVFTTDNTLQRVHLFRRDDGRMIERLRFRQPDIEDVLVELIESQGILCGPDRDSQSELIKGIDIKTGKQRWQIEVDKPVVQLFEPADGFIGIGLLGGDILVVRALTGEKLLQHRVSSAHSIIGGEMLDATFIVRSQSNNANWKSHELIAIDIPTGAVLWRRRDVVTTMSGEYTSMIAGRTIPAIVNYEDPKDQRRKRLGLTMIDTRTGSNIGSVTDLMSSLSGARLNGDFAVLSGAAIVGVSREIVAFPTTMVQRDTQGGF